MATVLQVFTTVKQIYVVRFCGQKDSMQKIFTKKYFLLIVGSVCRVKRFILGGKGFDALVKRWDKCINVGGGHVEK
jgi:hypothetical protein